MAKELLPKKTIVHIHTMAQAVFAEIDGDGNIVKKTPVSIEIPRLDQALFIEAFEKFVELRDDIATKKAE